MKLLVIRLSSLGDLILSTSFLENLPEDARVDWVTSKEFGFALSGHPKISKLIAFDKKEGFLGWVRMIAKLSRTPYAARIDLHRTLRSGVARWIFRLRDLLLFSWTPTLSVSKERFRTFLFLLFKKATPPSLRPTPYWKRFATLGQKVSRREGELLPPSFLPIIQSELIHETEILNRYQIAGKKVLSIVPASKWRTKEWGVDRYFDLAVKASRAGWIPLLLGRETDPACIELKARFEKEKIDFRDALKESNFKRTAILLKNSVCYVGGDTGLFHLAESVGTRGVVVFGPTHPDLGFGPWRTQSHAVCAPVECAPCSKDGKRCYRLTDPYACLKRIDSDAVWKEVSAS